MHSLPRDQRAPLAPAVLWAGFAFAALTAIALVTIDKPIARLMATYEPAPFWNKGIDLLELGTGLNTFPFFSSIVLAVSMLIAAAIPKTRVTVPPLAFVTVTHIVGQWLTGEIKEWTGRMRPLAWIKAGGVETSWGWVKAYSFPSGHVSIFASLVIPIVLLNPRRLWPLLVIVVYACCARIAVDAHWMSDVIGSLSLVLVLSWLFARVIRPLRPLE